MLSILFSNFSFLFILSYIGDAFLKKRYSVRIHSVLLLIFFFITSIIDYYGILPYRIIMMILLPFLYYLIMFKGDIIQYIHTIIPYPLLIFIINTLPYKMIYMVSINNIATEYNEFWKFVCTSISVVLIFLLVTLYLRISKLFLKMELPVVTWIIIILPVISIIILFNIHETFYNLIKKDNVVFISVMILFISNFMVLYLFYRVAISLQYKKELKEIKSRENTLTLKYELLNNQHEIEFKFLHDLLHRCCKLKIILENQNYTQLHKELNDLYEITFREFNAIYSNSTILNSIIAEYINDIKKNQITIRTVIQYNDFYFLSLDEQTNLFSKLLNYAISEVVEVKKDKFITIKTWLDGHQMILQIIYSANSYTSLSVHIKNDLDMLLPKHNAIYSKMYEEINGTTKIIIVFNNIIKK